MQWLLAFYAAVPARVSSKTALGLTGTHAGSNVDEGKTNFKTGTGTWRGESCYGTAGGFDEIAHDAESQAAAARGGPICLLAGGEAESEDLRTQRFGDSGTVVCDGEQNMRRRCGGKASAVVILGGDADATTGWHGVRSVAYKIDENAGEVFDGERGLSGAGHGGDGELDGRSGNGGKQRLQVAEFVVGGGDGDGGKRNGCAGRERLRRDGGFGDLFDHAVGAVDDALEILRIVAVVLVHDTGHGKQFAIEHEAGHDVARVVHEAIESVGVGWLV